MHIVKNLSWNFSEKVYKMVHIFNLILGIFCGIMLGMIVMIGSDK